MNGQQTPIAKFKAGAVSSALWENEIEVNGKTVTILKATVQRRYKDKEGNWQSSGSFWSAPVLCTSCYESISHTFSLS